MAGARILLVDDMEESLALLSRLLKKHFQDVTILTASNGTDGLAIAQKDGIDVVLLDAVMPGLDGFETCKTLKGDPRTAHIPVLMVSGVLTKSKDRAVGLECGADGYVCKPFEAAELVAQVRALVRIKRDEDALRRHERELEEELRSRTRRLEQSEDLFRKLFENSPDAVFVEDSRGNVLDVNRAACRLHGLSREELIGMHVSELVPPDMRVSIERDYGRQFTAGSGEFESVSFTKDGRSVPVEIRASRVDYAGTDALMLHVRDITERRQAEEQQRLMVNGLRAIVNIADDLIACSDVDSVYRLAVDRAREELGLERCTILVTDGSQVRGTYGTNMRGQTTDERAYRTDFDTTWRDRFRLRSPQEARWYVAQEDFREWTSDGMRKVDQGWIAITPIQTARKALGVFCNDTAISRGPVDTVRQDLVAVYCSLLGNILERKVVEAERTKLALALEQSIEAVIITDTSGTIEYVNSGFEKSTGYHRDEVIGKTPRILKSGKKDDAFYRELWDTLIRGDAWRGRIPNKRRDGTIYESEQVISPVRDAEGQIVGFLSVAEDVTRSVQMEAEFRQAQKMESIGRLAGGIAHDFNNLLTAILGFAQLVLDETDSASPVRGDVQEIVQAGERAAKLTKQLLAFGRKQIMQIQPVDINAIVMNMDQILRRTLGEDVELVTMITEGIGTIEADTGLLEQVLMNLAVNARDAMPRGGKLLISSAVVDRDQEDLLAHPEAKPGDYVLLSVKDTGAGMSPDVRERAFEPFFTTKEKGKGSGLGLSTVYGIVNQLRGHIELDTEPGKGTEFRIYFPRSTERALAPTYQPVETLPAGKERVLLVEDESTVRRLTLRQLRSLGYRVTEARNGEEALRLFQKSTEPIDLVLTDVIMPTMGGPELVDKVRQKNPNVKVVYMSGFAEELTMDQINVSNPSALVVKPFTREQLAMALRNALDTQAGGPAR
jgi:two-component system cell cycle sensor histidine kinase/response regulator CckA